MMSDQPLGFAVLGRSDQHGGAELPSARLVLPTRASVAESVVPDLVSKSRRGLPLGQSQVEDDAIPMAVVLAATVLP